MNERIRRIEREMWVMRGLLALVVLGAVAGMGARGGAEDVTVRSLTVVDENGTVRARLTGQSDGALLIMRNNTGPAVALSASDQSSQLLMSTEATTKVRGGHRGIALFTNHNKAEFRATSGSRIAEMWADDDIAVLSMQVPGGPSVSTGVVASQGAIILQNTPDDTALRTRITGDGVSVAAVVGDPGSTDGSVLNRHGLAVYNGGMYHGALLSDDPNWMLSKIQSLIER